MKVVILGFSKPKKLSIFAKAIMWADKIPYDHVYIKWHSDFLERDIIYQASKMAVNFESNVTFEEHSISVEEYEMALTDESYKQVLQFCMDNSNKPYGFKHILGFAYQKLCGKIGIKVSNPFPGNGHSFICSKLGAAILVVAKIAVLNESLDEIDPLDLNNIARATGLKRLK